MRAPAFMPSATHADANEGTATGAAEVYEYLGAGTIQTCLRRMTRVQRTTRSGLQRVPYTVAGRDTDQFAGYER